MLRLQNIMRRSLKKAVDMSWFLTQGLIGRDHMMLTQVTQKMLEKSLKTC